MFLLIEKKKYPTKNKEYSSINASMLKENKVFLADVLY
jgi:hypothetical protein